MKRPAVTVTAAAGASAASGAGRAGEVLVALDVLDSVLGLLGASDLAGFEGGTLATVARRLRRAETRLGGLQARTVTAAETSGVAADAGAVDGARWLSAMTGATPGSANRSRRLGRAMDEVPSLAEGVRSGRVDVEQASVIASAADTGRLHPAELDGLVRDAGRLDAGALRNEARRRQARADQAALERDEAHARTLRSLSHRVRSDGMHEGRYLLPAEQGEAVRTWLAGLTTPDPAETPDELRRTPEQRRADALVDGARAGLSRGDAGTVRAVRPHVTVVVPVTMLEADIDDARTAGAVGTLPDGSVLSAAATRRLLCDATVRRLVLDPDGRPLDVGRATRTWSGALRAASRAVDGGCRGPACRRPFDWTDLHHIRWWRHDGGTAIENGVPLCSRCHDLVHHHGWSVTMDPATRVCTWTAPAGDVTTTRPYGAAAPTGAGPPR